MFWMDTIQTETGHISGTVIGEPGKEVHIYRGIPFAAPPIGDLRWRAPHPAASWSGIRECTVFTKAAPQAVSRIMPFRERPQSEDCLYLNVLSPAKAHTDKLPVMVWMHGGGYETGTGNDPLYNMPRLPQHGIVLVTVNMRLGPIGLFCHPLLTKESPHAASGNYLFLDMIAALQWVQRNIAAFGGDPNNVTIFGESGGGAKVSNLMASPLAKGLFHKAICESGTSTGTFSPGQPLKELEDMGERFFAKLGVHKEKDPLEAARALPWRKIMEIDQALKDELNMMGPGGLWDAAVEGWFLSDKPINIFKHGPLNAVPFIACANQGELKGPGVLLLPFLIPAYVHMLSGVNKAGCNAYACIFDQVPEKWKADGWVSTHAMELCYVFGDWDNTSGFWGLLPYLFYELNKAKVTDPGLTDMDKEVSEAMMMMWARFAKKGDPNVQGLVHWPAYKEDKDQYLYITHPLEVKTGFSRI